METEWAAGLGELLNSTNGIKVTIESTGGNPPIFTVAIEVFDAGEGYGQAAAESSYNLDVAVGAALDEANAYLSEVA